MEKCRALGLWALTLAVGTSSCVTSSEKPPLLSTPPLATTNHGSSEATFVDFSPKSGPRPIGRAARTETHGVRIAWPGTGAKLRFAGSSLSVDLTDDGDNHFSVVVDGTVLEDKIRPGRGRHTLELVKGLGEGEHIVTLYKLTEALVGTTTVHGFLLPPGGRALPLEPDNRMRIELLGDSISAGYGNEGEDETCGFSPETENHYLTYGAIAARELNAELTTIAWSGKGVFTNRGSRTDEDTLPVIWDQTLPTERVPYEFDAPPPDAVIINLGTNDFAPEVADFSPFGPAYEEFVATVRTKYPNAHLFVMMGPLLTDGYPPGRKAYTTARSALTGIVKRRTNAGDDKIHFFEVSRATPEEGFGCDYHPSTRTHARMAEDTVRMLRERAGFR